MRSESGSRLVSPRMVFGPPPRTVPAGLGTGVAWSIFLLAAFPLAVASGAFYYGMKMARPGDVLTAHAVGAAALVPAAALGLLGRSQIRLAARLYQKGKVISATVARVVVVRRRPYNRIVHFDIIADVEGRRAVFRRFGRDVRGNVDLLVLDHWALLHLPESSAIGRLRPLPQIRNERRPPSNGS